MSPAGRTPSPGWPVVRTFSAARDHSVAAPTRSCASPREELAAELARSSLKMKRVDPPVRGFPRNTGLVMPPNSRIGAASAARSSLLRSMDQFTAFVAPSTCMGPPLTESPGWCQVNERDWHTAEPSGANTTVCRAIYDGMAGARRNGGDRCIGIKYRHDISSGCDALQERPVKIAGRSQTSALRMSPTGPPPRGRQPVRFKDRDFRGR